jgi:hypothetical protein
LTSLALQGCTLVTRRYLAHVRVLASSFLECHPSARFAAVVVDDRDGSLDREAEPFEVLDPEEIGMDPREHGRMAAMYEPAGLVSAHRSRTLRHLLDRGAETVIYLDADIQVFDELESVAFPARDGRIVLTPHDLEPAPLEYEREYLTAGIYNGGFLAVGQAARPFLDWLAARVARHCVPARDRGLFFGQRWLDFVPALFDHHVLRDPGCNVMSWNLHARDVAWNGSGYTVDGHPLRFFHFCGSFDPHRPDRVASEPDLPWMDLAATGAVRRVCEDYAARLLASGFDDAMATPYSYATLSDETPLDVFMRDAYRDALLDAERTGSDEPPNPFRPGEEDVFVAWLAAPERAGAPPVARYLLALWRARPDLQIAFPDVPGRDSERYLRWVHDEPANARVIPPAVLETAG